MSEGAVRGRLRMFVFGSSLSDDSSACRAHITRPRFEVKELGEIDMVPIALPTLDLEGHAVLSCGELAGLDGESGQVLGLDRIDMALLPGIDTRAARMGAWLASCARCWADQ